MKERVLWIGILLAIISWIGNYSYFQAKQLDQPIFLDHYYEVMIDQEDMFLTFYYLTNKINPAVINQVEIGDFKGYVVNNRDFNMLENNHVDYEQAFRHHYLKSVRVKLPTTFDKENLPYSFSKATFHFNNRPQLTTNIGTVSIIGNSQDLHVLQTRVSSSSNQHRESKSLFATEPVVIENIRIPFPEVEDDISVKLDLNQAQLKQMGVMSDGRPPKWLTNQMDKDWEDVEGDALATQLFPFELEAEEWFSIKMRFNPNRVSYFRFSGHIEGKTADGSPFLRLVPIQDNPYLTQEDVNSLIKQERRGEKLNERGF